MLLVLLLPALAVPDLVVDREAESARVRDEGPEAPPEPEKERPDPSEGESDDESVPWGRMAPQPGAFEQAQRAIRLPGLFKSAARPLEKQVTGVQHSSFVGTRVERMVAQARCVTTWLAIVAPTVRSHAPPRPVLVV